MNGFFVSSADSWDPSTSRDCISNAVFKFSNFYNIFFLISTTFVFLHLRGENLMSTNVDESFGVVFGFVVVEV